MIVQLNGEDMELAPGASVLDLLERMAVDRDRVAVVVNDAVVPKTTYRETVVQAGDRIELLTFAGGG